MSEQTSSPQLWHRDHPYRAVLKSQRCLTGAGSDKDVRHIEIDLGDSGMQWQPGDTLGVWIHNDPELVAELLALAGLSGDDKIELDGKLFSLTTLLSEVLEITQANPGFIKHYAEATGHPGLQALAADAKALRSYLDKRQVVDVLKQFPGDISAAAFITCFRHLMPRQYSIASSARVDARTLHLTVGQVLYRQDEELRKGAGSVYLGYRVRVGEQIPVFTVPNPNFRLPADATAPVIMIGPGTGIAPFRAFLQERAASGASGPNWLLFGNPRRASDYLYESELEAWRQSGVLARLDLAFSRDQADKRYVQHCLQEQAAEVFRWLENGASLYVCGDARRMAEDVQNTLLDIVAQQGGMDASAARQYLVQLRQQKRYQRDVY
jgi:sulfite reductase (NADPH) flavoprotein alpha-component